MMKRIVGVFLAAVLILGMVACGDSGDQGKIVEKNNGPEMENTEKTNPEQKEQGDAETPKTEEYESVDLRAAYMPNMGGASLLVTAKEKGYFEKYGLNVSLVEFGDGPSEIAAMASGDIDFAMIGPGAHPLCMEGKGVVFYSDAISLSSTIIGNKSHGVSSMEDLRGKSVAYVAGTTSEEILNLALSKVDMTMDDIEAVNFDVAGMVTAMVSGQVDAAASSQPYTSTIKEALKDDYQALAEDRDYLDERTAMNSEICTPEFAKKNPEVVDRIARALVEAADYRSENIEEIAKLVAKQCQGDEKIFLGLTEECIWLTGEEVNELRKDDSLKEYYRVAQMPFINNGRLEKAVPVEDYVLFDVIESACSAVYGE